MPSLKLMLKFVKRKGNLNDLLHLLLHQWIEEVHCLPITSFVHCCFSHYFEWRGQVCIELSECRLGFLLSAGRFVTECGFVTSNLRTDVYYCRWSWVVRVIDRVCVGQGRVSSLQLPERAFLGYSISPTIITMSSHWRLSRRTIKMKCLTVSLTVKTNVSDWYVLCDCVEFLIQIDVIQGFEG